MQVNTNGDAGKKVQLIPLEELVKGEKFVLFGHVRCTLRKEANGSGKCRVQVLDGPNKGQIIYPPKHVLVRRLEPVENR